MHLFISRHKLSLSAAGRDFVSGGFSLSFSPTATAPTSLPISVVILEDEVVEATEELVVVLSVPQGEEGVALLQNNSTVVILDEDGRHLYVAQFHTLHHFVFVFVTFFSLSN